MPTQREVEFIMVVALNGKGLHRCRIRCSWTSLLCQWVWRLQGGVMTKLIERNTIIPTKRGTDVHDAR